MLFYIYEITEHFANVYLNAFVEYYKHLQYNISIYFYFVYNCVIYTIVKYTNV